MGYYARKSGAATIATTDRTAVVTAVTGKELSVVRVNINPSAAAMAAGGTVSITDEDGTALTPAIPAFTIANEPIAISFKCGEHRAASGKGISSTSSTADSVGVAVVVEYI